ncbi:MAG: TonB-dependent receptor [Steroidobacteraceae bacterium]
MKKNVLPSAGAVLCAASISGIAMAQESIPVIEEVIVTAQRSAESIQKVSQSITAISGSDLEQLGVRNAADLAGVVPGVNIKQGGTPAVFIRGVGTSNSSVTGDQGVALHIDGIPQSRATAFSAGLFDLERVEVLKGPQGTLYGRGSIGGSINVITAAPKADFEAAGSAEFGNYGLFRSQGMINVPLHEATSTGVRLSFASESRDGYASNGGDDMHNSALRLRARSKPIEPLTLDLSTFIFRYNNTGLANYPLRTYSATKVADPGNWRSFIDLRQGYDDLDIREIALNVDYDLGFGVLTVLPSYAEIKNRSDRPTLATLNGVVGSNNFSWQDLDSTTKTQEVRLAAPAGARIKWVAGAFHGFEKNRYAVSNGLTAGYLSTDSTGFFAQTTVPITDAFRVVAGARQSREKKDQYTIQGLHFSADWKVFNYRASLEYDLRPQSMIYGTVATGFKAGGFFTSVAPNWFDPEEATVYEIGSKNRFMNGSLQLNLAAYFSKYDKYQVNNTIVAAFPGATTQGVFNGGAAEVKGGEAELIWQFLPADRVNFSVNYSDGKFTTITVVGTTAKVGDRLPSTAEFSSNLAYTHDFTLQSGMLSARAEMHYETDSWISLNHDAFSRQKAYTKSNLSLTYTPSESKWQLQAWVRNIEDVAVRTNINATLNNETINLAPPRTYGLTISAKL